MTEREQSSLFADTPRPERMTPYVPREHGHAPAPDHALVSNVDTRPVAQVGLPTAATYSEEVPGRVSLLDVPLAQGAAPDIRSALRQLREYREAVPAAARAALDVVLARLEPEYEELVRIYVHFESAADVADLGRLLGVPLTTSVRQIRYSRGHAEASGASAENGERSGRDKTFEELQAGLFEIEEWWVPLWRGMPEFDQRDLAPIYSVEVAFASWEDVEHFGDVIGQAVPRYERRTPSVWFPEAEIGRIAGRAWVDKSDERWQKRASA